MQGFAFLHASLIAHRVRYRPGFVARGFRRSFLLQDFARGEILANSAGGPYVERGYAGPRPAPYRSHFPIWYWINDFELSVQFDPDSDPATRLVTGIPPARYGQDDQTYNKDLPPEALDDQPYCPFKADVFQVGYCVGEPLQVRISFRRRARS